MRFLVDAPISRHVARALRRAGHDAAHVNDVGLDGAQDTRIVQRAREESRVVVTQDTDYGVNLVMMPERTPVSVILFRMRDARPATQAAVLLANLAQVETYLEAGAIVVLEDAGVRVRRLT